MFSEAFSSLLEYCNSNQFGDNFIIGGGNPDSKILFIGQEPSGDANNSNTLQHYNNADGKYDSWTRYRELERKFKLDKQKKPIIIEPNYWRYHTTLWYNYQLLFDYLVYGEKQDHSKILDFEENVFCSEINGEFSKKHADASFKTMKQRKTDFFTHPFFNKFEVIVLACGHCIVGTEISSIFKVVVSKDGNPEFGAKIRDNYWIHFDDLSNPKKILIHTRNLSGSMKKDFVKDMGIRIHLLIKEQLKIDPKKLIK